MNEDSNQAEIRHLRRQRNAAGMLASGLLLASFSAVLPGTMARYRELTTLRRELITLQEEINTVQNSIRVRQKRLLEVQGQIEELTQRK